MSKKRRKKRPKIVVCAFELPASSRNSWIDLLVGKGFAMDFSRDDEDPYGSYGPKEPVGFERAMAHVKGDGQDIIINAMWDKANEKHVLSIAFRDIERELHFAKEIEAIFAGQGWQRISPPLSQYDEYLE